MNESVLFKINILNIIGSIILIIIAVSFFKGRNIFNGFTKIKIDNNIIKVFVKIILPIAFIAGAVWFSEESIVDYIKKDYVIREGTEEKINAPYNHPATEEFYIYEDKNLYYLPKGYLKSTEKGKKFKFTYAKRSRIIIKIEEINK